MTITTSKELLTKMKADGIHLANISSKSGVKWHRLDKAMKGEVELRETDYRRLFTYASSLRYDV